MQLKRYIITSLTYLCLGFSAWFTLCFLYVVTISLFYPFPLEWMEGHTIDIIQRLLDGKSFYTAPSLEYVPYIYTPYYFYVSAFVSWFTGVGFFAARLVSLLSTLGICGVLFAWVRKEEQSITAGLIAAGLFIATYKISGRWFDVSRVDTLYVLLMAAGLYVYRFGTGRYNDWLAGMLFALAFFTKQSALIALLPAGLVALKLDGKKALYTAGIASGLIAAGCLLFEINSDGWFSFYIYDVPAGHGNDTRQISLFWTRDMFPYCTAMLCLSLVSLVFLFKRGWRDGLWYSAVTLGLFGSAYLSRVHSFGHLNVLIPAHFVMVLLAVLAFCELYRMYPKASIIAIAGLAMQFHVLLYDPMKLTPNPGAEEKGNQFIKDLATMRGDVLCSELQFIQTKADKKTYSIGMAGFDIMRSKLEDKEDIKRAYLKEIDDSLRQHKFGAIVVGHFLKVPGLNQYYRRVRTIYQPQEFVTGAVYMDQAQVFVPQNNENAR